MWDWINCHLVGRHEYVVWTNSRQMFLRCLRCGRRSHGWQVAAPQPRPNDEHTSHGRSRAGGHGFLSSALDALKG